jgi:VanZ family protein
MNAPREQQTGRRLIIRFTTRTLCACAAAGALAFLIYGSLIPFHLNGTSLSEAIRRVPALWRAPWVIDSRTDAVSNVLLLLPAGFFLAGALVQGSMTRRIVAGVCVLTICLGVGICVEFAQLFIVGRTAAVADVLAQCIGTILGLLMWLVFGDPLIEWVRSRFTDRSVGGRLQTVLTMYVVAFAFVQLLPLDVTLSLSEIARKYRDGRIVLLPFTAPHASVWGAVWDGLVDVASYVPVGAWCLRFTSAGRYVRAFALGACYVAAVELSQVFIVSRYADTTDLLTGCAGVALGVWAMHRWSPAPVGAVSPAAPAWRFVGAAMAWSGFLCWVYWWPFDFSFQADQVRRGVHSFASLPFAHYYEGTEFHAASELVKKIILGAPLGWTLSRAAGRHPAVDQRLRIAGLLVIAATVLGCIEFGQVFLPDRVADVTDVLLGVLGAAGGLLTTLFPRDA